MNQGCEMNESKTISSLPKDLKNLVNITVELLGEVIKEEAGDKNYKLVESIRLEMVKYRKMSQKSQQLILETLFNKLKSEKRDQRHIVSHSFTLMLELINTCESAYRTYRLKEDKTVLNLKKHPNNLVYVLTAHPTEARTTQNIDLFHRIQEIALIILERSGETEYLLDLIKHNLKLAWLLPITLHKKPEVVDEANHLFSIILRPDIFNTLLRANRDLGLVRVRTWVGGDKDGHPGVDEKVMLNCLQASRNHFLVVVKNLLINFKKDLTYINRENLDKEYSELNKLLMNLKTIKKLDSDKIDLFKKQLLVINDLYTKNIGSQNPRLKKLFLILDLFPALVIPIELREDSEIISLALSSKDKLAIERMLIGLAEIANKDKIHDYAQGMIISMCESFEDIKNAMTLLKNSWGDISIPIIPLFETEKALIDSYDITKKAIEDKEFNKYLRTKWNKKFEIMLGYSDSSKAMGVFASRLGIAKTMRSLDELICKNHFIPIFFHGSGGSVDRGGGSLQEQTSWWPKSALQIYKATIQGEMVERNFSTKEITLSGMNKVLSNFDRLKTKKGLIKTDPEVEHFAKKIRDHYFNTINNKDFYHMVEKATPYSYLNVLKLGSRPAKRAKAKALDFSSIRAIPWVLCWTQTRTLFPTWWGVGTAWTDYKNDEVLKQKLKKAFSTSNIFSSFIRLLGYSLSKVDLQVFELYLSKSSLSDMEKKQTIKDFREEYKRAVELVLFLTGETNLLWFRPWLKESILYRSSMIHPLNCLQIIGNMEKDEDLVRKSTAGISMGMMTTG